MLSFNSNGTNNISGKQTQFLQIKVDKKKIEKIEKDLSDSIVWDKLCVVGQNFLKRLSHQTSLYIRFGLIENIHYIVKKTLR